MGDAWSLPEATTTAEPILELRSEGFNCPTANGRASLSHRLIKQMVAMVLKVVYFPFHDLLDFGGALGWAFMQLFQAPEDSHFLSMTQSLEELLTHSWAWLVPSPCKAWPSGRSAHKSQLRWPYSSFQSTFGDWACKKAVRSRKASATLWITGFHSPIRLCRKRRMVGYHGVSARSTNQRQSAAN